MTTLTINTYNGFQVAPDQQILSQVNNDQVVDNSSACELPILADGLRYRKPSYDVNSNSITQQ